MVRAPRCVLAVLLGVFFVYGVAQAAVVSEGTPAKSAILFIGDGMGPMQILLGQAANGGERLRLQRLPYSANVTTLDAHGGVTDSADSCTAYSSGHKTSDHLGLEVNGQRTWTTAEEAMAEGKSVGIISNDALYGATPAGFVAHAESRGMYPSIAEQISRCGATVLMGSGAGYFLPKSMGGKREDDKNLVAEMQRAGYTLVRNRTELARAANGGGVRLLGLFEDETAPTLAEQVAAALPRLRQNKQGFMLVVEQARVDWEPGDASAVAQDVLALDAAVQVALNDAVQNGDTLVIVTADHETGGCLILNPQQTRLLRNIPHPGWTIAGAVKSDRSNLREVMQQYATITDLTDAELKLLQEEPNVELAITQVISARSGVKWCSEGDHTMTPVRLYAFGPGANAFQGDIDNTDIAKRMGRAFLPFWAD